MPCALNDGRDAADVADLRGALRVVQHDLVVGAGLDAVRGAQHQVRRDHRAGTEIAPRADDGDDAAAESGLVGGSAADHGGGRRGCQRKPGGE